MAGDTHITVVGTVTADPELKYTKATRDLPGL